MWGTTEIEETYIPIAGKLRVGRWGFRLTVPYLSIRAPSGTVITDSSGQPIVGTGAIKTQSGLGDIVAGVTLYDVINERERGVAMDLTGKIKLATADENKGLGTGELDYSAQAELYKFFDQLTLVGIGGYRIRGDPADVNYENVFFGTAGAIYRVTAQTKLGLMVDYRQSALAGGESIRELSGFVSQRLNADWRLQAYALTGFSDSSPDWGVGVLLKNTF